MCSCRELTLPLRQASAHEHCFVVDFEGVWWGAGVSDPRHPEPARIPVAPFLPETWRRRDATQTSPLIWERDYLRLGIQPRLDDRLCSWTAEEANPAPW